MPELRKVQETHKRTLIISLPKSWGPRFPVVAGDHLALDLRPDGSVLMRREGHALPETPARLIAAYRGAAEVLDAMLEPYLAGAGGLEVAGMQEWDAAEAADLRQAMRRRFGAEVFDEGEGRLAVRFVGADRPEQARAVARRLAQLGAAALRGEEPDREAVARQHLLCARLVGLAAAMPGPRPLGARQAEAVLRVAHAALLLAGPGAPAPDNADAELADWFEAAAARLLDAAVGAVMPSLPVASLASRLARHLAACLV